MKFVIDQIALCPRDPQKAIDLLKRMGLEAWVHDTVVALGNVKGQDGPVRNAAHLAFNYEAFADKRELEVLHYFNGDNWMESELPRVSHLGMHCTEAALDEWKKFFADEGVPIVQEVNTWSHTNEVIAGKRWYHYCIFGTHPVLGVDVKFIVRRNGEAERE